jgi:hypothetical protein
MALKIRGGVQRVTVLRANARGALARQEHEVDDVDDDLGVEYVLRDKTGRVRYGTVVEDLGPPKKQSKLTRKVDKQIHKYARRNAQTMSRYMRLHDRSNRLKKNGWLRDLGKNLIKAMRKS